MRDVKGKFLNFNIEIDRTGQLTAAVVLVEYLVEYFSWTKLKVIVNIESFSQTIPNKIFNFIMTNNIVLIGFMGSGKSSVAKCLAQTLQKTCVSTDALVEQQVGMAISQIFETQGEAAFRQMEKEVVEKLLLVENYVIDCGGGIILNVDNFVMLKKIGTVIFLSAKVESIYERVKNTTHRPLLQTENPLQKIKDLLNARLPLYQQADITVETDGKTVEEVGCEIIEKKRNKK